MPTSEHTTKTKKAPAKTGTPRTGATRGKKPSVIVTKEVKSVNVPATVVSVVKKTSPQTPKGYYRALGRRKEATARVRMMETGTGNVVVNGRPFDKYFPSAILRDEILAPLKIVGQFDNHDFSIKVEGGGSRGQAEAVRHGFARVLLQWNAEFRPPLKKAGFLKRDPRAKERKKFGLKGARRAPQWAKR